MEDTTINSQCLNKANSQICNTLANQSTDLSVTSYIWFMWSQNNKKYKSQTSSHRGYLGIAIVKTFEKADSRIRAHILCEFPWSNIIQWRTREVEETLGLHEYIFKLLRSHEVSYFGDYIAFADDPSRHVRWIYGDTRRDKTLAGIENSCTGDKTLAQIENNSTNTNTFINHYIFPQIRNTHTNHKTLAHKALKPGY